MVYFGMIFYFSFLDFVFVCIECIFDQFLFLFSIYIFFCRIKDGGRPYMRTHFIMEDEMVIIVVNERFSSSMVIAPPLVELLIVNQCHKKEEQWMMRQNVEGRWNDIALVSILNIYEEEWRRLNKSCLSFKHQTHIHNEHHCQLLNKCHYKKKHIKDKIENMKG